MRVHKPVLRAVLLDVHELHGLDEGRADGQLALQTLIISRLHFSGAKSLFINYVFCAKGITNPYVKTTPENQIEQWICCVHEFLPTTNHYVKSMPD